jgi:tungstate transport system ATP-binding protein
MTSAVPLLELRGLRVKRGGVDVLDVPSFRLHEGELVALIGPNGSGKSSLLLSLMCLLEREAGELWFRGRKVAADRAVEHRRRIAMVLQEPLLFDATVLENVASGLRIRGLARHEARRRATSYLDRFRLGELADRSARRLSGGEARRVSLARALAVEPDVVLLDEPFANLDPPTRQSIVDDLERTFRGSRMAAVFVTHDRTEALHLSDRLAVMNGGRIVQCDAPAVVMNDPVDAFVASCVGMETILPGFVRRAGGGEIVVEVLGREIDAVGGAAVGEQVYCCIRPENVTVDLVDPAASTSARNVFPARIVSVSSMGAYLKVKLDCGFQVVAHVTAESFATLRLEPGKQVFAAFKATAVHVIRKGLDGAARQAG